MEIDYSMPLVPDNCQLFGIDVWMTNKNVRAN
jgi:hypothetical protein